MAEYIDREAVLATAFETLPLVGTSPAEAMGISRMSAAFYRAVRNIPAADVVPVVRCRECVNWRSYENRPADCDLNMVRMEPDGFCSWGQRREDGGADDG